MASEVDVAHETPLLDGMTLSEPSKATKLETLEQVREAMSKGVEVQCLFRDRPGYPRVPVRIRMVVGTFVRLWDGKLVDFYDTARLSEFHSHEANREAPAKQRKSRDGSAVWETSLQRCYDRGAEARTSGKSRESCPYRPNKSGALNVQRRHWWLFGWDSGGQ